MEEFPSTTVSGWFKVGCDLLSGRGTTCDVQGESNKGTTVFSAKYLRKRVI